jgi:Protein of unknown function (DUF2637)
VTGTRDPYRTATTAAVIVVAGIAAAVSFVHIESLAITYGQPLAAALMLPLSIDGTVAVSSLAMLRSARTGLSTPWLARAMLLLSVVATLACNVAYGLPHGWPGALLSGWPAVAFVGSAEVAIGLTRRTVRKPAAPAVTTTPVRAPVRRTARPDSRAAILAALSAAPSLSAPAVAAQVGVSARTVRRVRASMNGAAVR